MPKECQDGLGTEGKAVDTGPEMDTVAGKDIADSIIIMNKTQFSFTEARAMGRT
jgi:hypothetical protein